MSNEWLILCLRGNFASQFSRTWEELTNPETEYIQAIVASFIVVAITQKEEEEGEGDEKFLINGQGREWVLTRIVEIDQVVLALDEEQMHADDLPIEQSRWGLLTFNLNRARGASSILIATSYNEDDEMQLSDIRSATEFHSKNYLISQPRYRGFARVKASENLIIYRFARLKEHVYVHISVYITWFSTTITRWERWIKKSL